MMVQMFKSTVTHRLHRLLYMAQFAEVGNIYSKSYYMVF